MLAGCAVTKFVPDDALYLKDVSVVAADDERVVKEHYLKDYIVQTPNSKWFGARVPVKFYSLAGRSDRWYNKLIRRIGEAPVVYDSVKAEKAAGKMRVALANSGYMHSEVRLVKHVKGRKLSLEYNVSANEQYLINRIRRDIPDSALYRLFCGTDTAESLLCEGTPFDVNTLGAERKRMTNLLRDMGYYKFNKEYIHFVADTIAGSNLVDVTVMIAQHQDNAKAPLVNHRQYHLGDVKYMIDATDEAARLDSVYRRGHWFYYPGKRRFRSNLITSNNMMRDGALFNNSYYHRTLQNYNRLPAISYSNILLTQRGVSDTLDCSVFVKHAKPYSIGADVEATNSAGDLGAALSASVQHNNLFRGSETLMIKLRGAYEAITGLEGYEGHNYWEVGGELRLTFPLFLLPYVKRDWALRHGATSEISLQYNSQDRPEFNRRVLTGAWRYRWHSHNRKVSHRFDLLEVNYVYMPWISKTFKEQYLDSIGKTNAILKYNYENLLITKLGYTFNYNSLGVKEQTYGKNALTYRVNIETSGNLLQGITHTFGTRRNDDGQYMFCGIAFAQYVRGDFDIAKSIRIDKNNSLALRAAFGIAYPYGNSKMLPFEKRYFAGGANSVRGWSVRSLGPGSYNGADKGINFINQSGDIKLDLSLEYRAYLFWKLNGAVFVDAGNIWTIRKYEDQPGGEFRFDKFYEQIAVSYGIGFRLNLDFFVIRFDGGMKAVNPAYNGRNRYPIYHPSFKRDFAFHFAVGLPF